jgi:hypothetical protein
VSRRPQMEPYIILCGRTSDCQHLHICWWILGRSPPDSFWPGRKQVQLPSGKHTKS